MVSGQRHEVDRLTEQVGRCRTVIDSILSLAEQLKEGTIERRQRYHLGDDAPEFWRGYRKRVKDSRE